MTIEEMMITETPIVNDFDSILEAVEFLSRRKLDAAYVVDLEQNLVGYFSVNSFFQDLVDEIGKKHPASEDIPNLFIQRYREIAGQEVSDYMNEDVDALTPAQDIEKIFNLFVTTDQEYIPILKDKQVIGMLGKTRFLESLLKQ